MFECPTDGTTMLGEATGGDQCPRCHGSLVGGAWLEQGGIDSSIEIVDDPSSPLLLEVYKCPECERSMAPHFIQGTKVALWRCPGCARLWLPKGVRASIERIRLKRAREEAFASLPEHERKDVVRDIVESQRGPDELPLSLQLLAWVGFPVVRGALRHRTPVFSLLLAAWLVGVHVAITVMDIDPATLGYLADHPGLWSGIRALFVHNDWLHLLGNTYFVLAFGAVVEQRVPRWVAALAFLGGGLAATGIEGLVSAPYTIIYGASGGAAVLLGMALVLERSAHVVVRVVALLFRMRLVTYGVFWALYQVLMGSLGETTVAWWAHGTGFGIGLLLALVAPRVDPD